MKINFRNKKTGFKVTKEEATEYMCLLIIFCNMNGDSKQASKLKRQLLEAELALDKGKFNN